MFYGDPFNPTPLQSRQGLENKQFGYYPDWAHGCFDQASVPPAWIVNGRLLIRNMRHSGLRPGLGFWLQVEDAVRKFGPAGERMFRELNDAEFVWNRNHYESGGGWAGGFPYAYALWYEIPDPASRQRAEEQGVDLNDPFAMDLFYQENRDKRLKLGASIWHYGIVLNEFELLPKWHSWSCWSGQPVPGDVNYIRNREEYENGYPLFVRECVEHPENVGEYVSPYALEPITMFGVGRQSKGRQITAIPFWF